MINENPCEYCGRPINSNNKSRTSCKECKTKYPMISSEKGGRPFNRQEKIFGVGNWKKFGGKE